MKGWGRPKGKKHTAETRKKISAKVRAAYARRKMEHGEFVTAETRKKISAKVRAAFIRLKEGEPNVQRSP